jgi:hypothetical protein
MSNRSKDHLVSSRQQLVGHREAERLRGLQVDPDQLLRGRGTRSNSEWGTVSFLKVEERHECHGG